MIYNLLSINSTKLVESQKKSICLLKDQHWKFGIKSQMQWFKKYIKPNDIHNLFYVNSKLAGYTLLRKRTYSLSGQNKLNNYYHFDTLVIHKNYRGKNMSNLFMIFNNTIIKESNHLAFLICRKELVSFYKKFNWKKLNNKNISLQGHPFSTNGMIFKENNISKKKYYFNVNK